MQQNPEISVITVGMNHKAFMEKLLQSLFIAHRPDVPFEMIYVDNCSVDGSVHMIAENFTEVKIIQNSKPLGFGANNNLGVQHARGKYIAIINPDIELQDQSLDSLLNFHEKLTYDAILVPKLINPDGTLQFSARGFVTGNSLVGRIITRGQDDSPRKSVQRYLFTDINSDQIQFVDWAIGAAFFMKKSLFEKLGGFDEDYFLYLEDTDLCLRSWKSSNPVIYMPNSVMVHNHLRSSSKKVKLAVIHLKSYLKYFRKHGLKVKSLVSKSRRELPD